MQLNSHANEISQIWAKICKGREEKLLQFPNPLLSASRACAKILEFFSLISSFYFHLSYNFNGKNENNDSRRILRWIMRKFQDIYSRSEWSELISLVTSWNCRRVMERFSYYSIIKLNERFYLSQGWLRNIIRHNRLGIVKNTFARVNYTRRAFCSHRSLRRKQKFILIMLGNFFFRIPHKLQHNAEKQRKFPDTKAFTVVSAYDCLTKSVASLIPFLKHPFSVGNLME